MRAEKEEDIIFQQKKKQLRDNRKERKNKQITKETKN